MTTYYVLKKDFMGFQEGEVFYRTIDVEGVEDFTFSECLILSNEKESPIFVSISAIEENPETFVPLLWDHPLQKEHSESLKKIKESYLYRILKENVNLGTELDAMTLDDLVSYMLYYLEKIYSKEVYESMCKELDRNLKQEAEGWEDDDE